MSQISQPTKVTSVKGMLALLIVGSYAGMWIFVVQYAIRHAIGFNELMQSIGDFAGVISTMTVIVVLVVQYFFRSSSSN